MDSSIITSLFMVAFMLALTLGNSPYRKARKARGEHYRSVSASAKPDQESRTADAPRPQ